MITQQPPDSADAMALIRELEEELATRYDHEHRHGFTVQRLLDEKVNFFIIHDGNEPAGCSGLLCVGSDYAEIKRMYIRPAFRRRGLAKRLLDHLADFARERGISRLRLETGIHQREAIALYEQYGFGRIPAFGHYPDNDISLCYEKSIARPSRGGRGRGYWPPRHHLTRRAAELYRRRTLLNARGAVTCVPSDDVGDLP